MQKLLRCIAVACAIVVVSSIGHAQIIIFPEMNYQGRLQENGTQAPDGVYPMEFRIYDVELGGTALWTESQMVQVTDGVFDVQLGSVNAFPDWFLTDIPRWLEVVVNGEALTPRTKLSSVPSAHATRRVRGDIETEPGRLMVSDPGCPNDTCPRLEMKSTSGIASLSMHNTQSSPEQISIVVDTEILSMDFSYDGYDRLSADVDASTTNLSLVQYDPLGDTTASLIHAVGNGTSTQRLHIPTPAGGMSCIVQDVDQFTSSAEYEWTSPVERNWVALDVDTAGSAATLGSVLNDDGWSVDLQAHNDYGAIELWRMDDDILQLRGDPTTTSQTLYHRNQAGDPTSGLTQTADANGAQLMVSDYGIGGTDGITLSTGTGGSLISVSGVGSEGTAGLVLRNDRVRLGEVSTAVPNSVAMGNRAKANHAGSFVLADMSAMDLASTAPGQFLVRASGGTTIYSNAVQTTGVNLPPNGGQWEMVSDSALKSNIRPVDGVEILNKLSTLPISRWNYEGQPGGVDHIGPMAQDFYRAFELGGDETKISSLDPSGVALAAIKELVRENNQLKSELQALRARVDALTASR